MKLTRLMICAMGAAWLGLIGAAAPGIVKAAGPAVPISTLTDQIGKAKTPSDAIAAYASASAQAGETDVNVEQAFVSRMVELGVPEMAEKQAEDLAGRTDSGMPWAVLAHNSARTDQIERAIEQISYAVKASPSNDFVARTAGEIIAWYDAQPQDAKISDQARQTAENVRSSVSSRRPYSEAYDGVKNALSPRNDNQGVVVNVDGPLGDLSAFNGPGIYGPYAGTPMSIFYAAPYLAFPNYSYAYQPWGPRFYASGAFARLGDRVPFPTPTIGADVRYLRTPTPNNGFVLLGDDGAISYFPAYYPMVYPDYGYYGGPAFYSGAYFPGSAGFFYGTGSVGGNRFAGRAFGGPGVGFAGGRRAGFGGGPRAMTPGQMGGIPFNSAAGQTPFQPMSTPFQPITTPGGQQFGGIRPGLRTR